MTSERFYWLVLGILGVWRVTHLLHAEDGPWNVMARLRRSVGHGFWAGVLDCFYCASVWVAAPFAWLAGSDAKTRLLLWPALSAGAILLERATTRGAAGRTSYWKEENIDVLLREDESAARRSGSGFR